jgi:ribosomal protein S18 acetylase RimI-like enzyme
VGIVAASGSRLCEDGRVDSVDGVMQVAEAHGTDAVQESAAIWAHATTLRDQQPATVEGARPGIQRRLRIPGAKLFLARRADRPVGFALVAPRPQTLEVFYLGVDPEAWGSGVGTRLLLSVEDHAREIGRETLELWVINDNERAIRVYRRSGWVGTEEVQRDTSSGRLERRFIRHLGQPVASTDALGARPGDQSLTDR